MQGKTWGRAEQDDEVTCFSIYIFLHTYIRVGEYVYTSFSIRPLAADSCRRKGGRSCLPRNKGSAFRGQRQDEGIYLLLTHAAGKEIGGEGGSEGGGGQLRLVADAGIVHQAGVESQRHEGIAYIGVLGRGDMEVVVVGDEVVGHYLLIGCSAQS